MLKAEPDSVDEPKLELVADDISLTGLVGKGGGKKIARMGFQAPAPGSFSHPRRHAPPHLPRLISSLQPTRRQLAEASINLIMSTLPLLAAILLDARGHTAK